MMQHRNEFLGQMAAAEQINLSVVAEFLGVIRFPVQFQNPAVARFFLCRRKHFPRFFFQHADTGSVQRKKNPVTAVLLLRRKCLRQTFCFAVRSIHKIEAHLHSAAADHAKPLPLSGSEIVFSVFTFLLLHQLLRMQNRLIFQVSAADSSENPSFPADQHIGARRARNGAVPFGDKGKNRVLSLFQLCKQFPVKFVHVSSPCV